MPCEAKEECGVAAVFLKEDGETANKALFYLYRLLLNLQNRGQLSAGITTYNKNRPELIDTYKELGTVNEVFKTSDKAESLNIFKRYSGNKGIGHVRYATFGADDRSYAQPLERHHGRLWKWFSFCFNGNLVNYSDLKDALLAKKDYHMIFNTDTEIIMHYTARELMGGVKPNLTRVFSNLSQKFDGAYNIVFINAYGDMVICRDPYGFRPLSYCIKNGSLFVASESNALANCGLHNYKPLEPGNLILVKNGNIEIQRYAQPERVAHCMFEWVYFSNVSSILDGQSVYLARTNLGKELAKLEYEKITKDHIVVPVPDTAKAAGDAMAYELGIPSMEGLIRNRYVGRTFIESTDREDRIQNKYTVLQNILEGKKVLLVDDSIVRGLTTQQIVRYIKKVGGAKEVHVRVSCPPIRGPCFYGIDMSTLGELMVPKYNKNIQEDLSESDLKAIAHNLGADSVAYNTIPGLIRSIGLPKNKLCMACLNGDYPTQCGKSLFKKAEANFIKGKKEEKRSYEC